jgi:membrane protein YfhO
MVKSRGLLWPLVALMAAIVPIGGIFTFSRIFFVRDLSLAFRPRFLFLRHVVATGTWPLWDPYPANGQSAVNDALYQLFHVPSLLVRLLLPEVPAYNLWVALPVPIAALGTYLFLRRLVTAPAAMVGACAFAVGGPMVSTTNFPNMSWSVAAVPFVFWALDRLIDRRRATDAALVAIMVALQALAGEPVTLTATLAIAGAYAAFPGGGLRRPQTLFAVAAALLAGVLLASIQFVPLFHASRESARGAVVADDFWSFHPLAALEFVVPHFFGDYFNSHLNELAWMLALNSHREPFYYTMYIGVPVVLAASVAALSGRPRTVFWTVVVVACGIASLGSHTVVYPLLQQLVPPLRAFRFPVKYLSLAAFGIATLASFTIQWLIDREVPRRPLAITVACAVLAALVTYGLVGWLLVAPHIPVRLFYKLAVYVGVPAPVQGAEYLIFRARPLLTTLFLKLLCGSFLLWVAASARRERTLATTVFGAVLVLDLVASNSGVNPTMAVESLSGPAWLASLPPALHERVYIGGRLGGYVDTFDVDAPKYATSFDGASMLDERFLTVNELVYYPSGAAIREALSYDLPILWPLDYAKLLGRFKMAGREDRLRLLERAGVRYAVLPTPPFAGAPPLATLRGVDQMKLYDFNPGARRVYVVPDALIGPDFRWQLEGLFQPRFHPDAGVLVSESPPPPAGVAGPPVPASAAFEVDGVNEVIVRAGLPAEGYLALLDSYDPDWDVTVDNLPAELMRANAVFRAVHLRIGQHTVRFSYRPRALRIGALMSLVTALALLAWCTIDSRRRPTTV